MKYTIRLEKPVTDYLVADLEVEADSQAHAEVIAMNMIDEGDDALDSVEFRFDQCGDSGAIDIVPGHYSYANKQEQEAAHKVWVDWSHRTDD